MVMASSMITQFKTKTCKEPQATQQTPHPEGRSYVWDKSLFPLIWPLYRNSKGCEPYLAPPPPQELEALEDLALAWLQELGTGCLSLPLAWSSPSLLHSQIL